MRQLLTAGDIHNAPIIFTPSFSKRFAVYVCLDVVLHSYRHPTGPKHLKSGFGPWNNPKRQILCQLDRRWRRFAIKHEYNVKATMKHYLKDTVACQGQGPPPSQPWWGHGSWTTTIF